MTRKNLLEAFQRSEGASPSGGAPLPSAPGDAPRSALGGFATLRPARSFGLPLALLAVALAFALGYLAGRGTGTAEAADGDGAGVLPEEEGAALPPPVNQPRAFQEPAPSTAADPAVPARIEESALFDPANLYTVAVASYGKNHPDLAWSTYEHLKAAGLAVFPPIESGNMLALFVGAAPTSAALADTEAAVKKLTRDGKKAAYGDAYRARIDKLIPRQKAN